MRFDTGGDGTALLVLLHGLAATRQVWSNFVAVHQWHGSWLAPDLCGHGVSPHLGSYSLDGYAADIAEVITARGQFESIVVLGHSLGGAVALTLASGSFGIRPDRVFGLGIKVLWSADELAAMRKVAATPIRYFANREEAVARYLKVSGLHGLVAPESAVARSGVVETPAGWRLAYDPHCAAVDPPPMADLLGAAQAPVHLARGSFDPMNTREQLARFDSSARDLSSGGHNVMVEDPRAVWAWLEKNLP